MTKKVLIIVALLFTILGGLYGLFMMKWFSKNGFSFYKEGNMKITTTFTNGEKIPKIYTCDGDDTSPELLISDVPEEAKTLVLIVDDPDAPMGTFTHWVLYNIPADTAIISSQSLPKGALEGANDFGRLHYGGPCPPSGVHRYYFKLYAVDKILDLSAGATKTEVQNAIRSHTVQQAELIGLYSRK